jgi:hypothetical protein
VAEIDRLWDERSVRVECLHTRAKDLVERAQVTRERLRAVLDELDPPAARSA